MATLLDEETIVNMLRICLIAALFVAQTRGGAVIRADEAISPQGEAIRLFNGRDLAGWRTWLRDAKHEDPRGVFTVRDGMIRISGDGLGYLASEKAYRDYRLVVEFRWGEKNYGDRQKAARDSGIFLHSQGPDGNSFDGGGAFKAAIECQIMQGAVGDLLIIKGRGDDGGEVRPKLSVRAMRKRDADGWPTFARDADRDAGASETVELAGTGRVNWFDKDADWRDELDFRGRRDVEGRKDEWTRVECQCRGDTIRVYVGGTLVNEVTGASLTSGPILLQCEGSEIFFRRVDLHPLGD